MFYPCRYLVPKYLFSLCSLQPFCRRIARKAQENVRKKKGKKDNDEKNKRRRSEQQNWNKKKIKGKTEAKNDETKNFKTVMDI